VTQQFEIIWPERRWVNAAKIETWFSDAVANGDLSEEFATDVVDVEDKARELDSLGYITLGRGRR
jgi:hypothetical protein